MARSIRQIEQPSHDDFNILRTYEDTTGLESLEHSFNSWSASLRQELLKKVDDIEKRLRMELALHGAKTAEDTSDGPAQGKSYHNRYDEEDDGENDPREYEIQESVWDTFLIAGLHTRGLDFAFLVLVALVNFCIQLAFCLIVHQHMVSPTITHSTLENTALWRMIVGHKAEYYDPLTDTSLVTRVCNSREYSIMAGGQASQFAELNGYVLPSFENFRADDILHYVSPPLLCVICLVIWILNTIGEMQNSFDFLRAVWSLPRASSKSNLIFGDGDELVFASITIARQLLMTFLVVVPKLFITGFLGYMGVLYLVYTPLPEDLILNALALQCVQDMDEFLYGHLMPMRIRKLLTRIIPIPISKNLRYPVCLRRVFCMRSITVFVLLCISLGCVIPTFLFSELENVKETTRILCEGKRNFIYARDAATGLVSTADTSDAIDVNEIFQSYAFGAVLQKTGLAQDQEASARYGWQSYEWHPGRYGVRRRLSAEETLYAVTSSNKVHEMFRQSFVQASSLLDCEDLVAENASVQAAFYEATSGAMFCGSADCSIPQFRAFCPVTCQCNVAISGMLNLVGCSDACLVEAETGFNRDLQAVSTVPGACEDRDNKASEFGRYFRELQNLLIEQEKLAHRDAENEPDFVWLTNEMLLMFAFGTEFRYWLPPNRTIDLGTLAYASYTNTVAANFAIIAALSTQASTAGTQNTTGRQNNPCKFIEVVWKMFAFDACHPTANTLDGNAGSLRSLCPRTCGYCDSAEPNTNYRSTDWDTLYRWMAGVADIDFLMAVSYARSCELYRHLRWAPTFFTVYMDFCNTTVGVEEGFARWFTAYKEVYPALDVLEIMGQMEGPPLPTSTTTTPTTTTTTSTTITSTTTTSTTTTSTTTTTTFSTTRTSTSKTTITVTTETQSTQSTT